MLSRAKNSRRRGALMLECALVYPITFLLLLGLVIGGMGIFRFQEAAALARAGARYAGTHGNNYRRDTAQSAGSPGSGAATTGMATGSSIPAGVSWYNASPTSASGSDTSWTGDVYDHAIRSNLVALDPSYLNVQAGWLGTSNSPGSVVYVTVSYNWLPELYVVGPIRLQSTASCPVTN